MSLFIVSVIIAVIVFVFYSVNAAAKNNPKNRAELFLTENRIDEAIAEFKKIVEKHPYDVPTHWTLARLYLKQKKTDLAADHLEFIINLDQYSGDITKEAVFKLLADIHLKGGDKLKAFELFYDLLYDYPSDIDGLYHVGFLLLGQELFEAAYKHLELLSRIEKKNFEILFGAGIAALQSHKINEAILSFKDALSVQSDSDIANIAMAFVLFRKPDLKSAVNYVRNVISNSKDNNAIFIAKRLLAFIYVEMKNYPLASALLEELRENCFNNGLEDELKMILYDLGFAYLADNRNDEAHTVWNELFLMDRSYKDTIDIVTRLKQELEAKPGSKKENQKPVISELWKWKKDVFHENFLWDICGLKSDIKMDLQAIISSGRKHLGLKKNLNDLNDAENKVLFSTIDDIYKLDTETFRRVSYKLCEKLGFTVDEIMSTYKGFDGVDFLATQKDNKTKTLIWIRRWKDTNIGEIPLRNFAQAINDVKVKQGYFIATSPLSAAGEAALNSLEKVKVIFPEELSKHLKGLI